MTSIRVRLASGLAVSLALVLVAIGMGSSLAIRHAVEGYLTTRLDHDAQRLTMALRTFPDGRIRVMPHRIDSVFGREHSGRYFRIQTAVSDLRSPSLGNHDLPLPPLSIGEAVTLRTTGPAEQPLFLRVQALDSRGLSLVIAVAEDWGPAAEAVRRWQVGFGAITAIGLLLVLALQALAARTRLPADGAYRRRTGRTRSGRATEPFHNGPRRGTASGVGHHRAACAPQVCIGVETSVGVSVGEARRLAKCRRPGYEGRVRGKAPWCTASSYTGLSGELHLCHLEPGPSPGWQNGEAWNPSGQSCRNIVAWTSRTAE